RTCISLLFQPLRLVRPAGSGLTARSASTALVHCAKRGCRKSRWACQIRVGKRSNDCSAGGVAASPTRYVVRNFSSIADPSVQSMEAHRTCRIARDADGHAPPAKRDISQCERAPSRRQSRRICIDEPGLTNPETSETVDQALQVRPGAGEKWANLIARGLRADIVRWLERPAGLEQLGPVGGLLAEPYRIRGGHARQNAHADLSDGS